MNKLDIIIQKFCASKDTVKKVRTQPTGWEKIFANHVFENGLTSKIYKELLQLKDEKTNSPI